MALSFQSIENIETWTKFEIANNDQEHISLYNLLPFFFMAFAMPFSATLIYHTVLLNYLQCFISEVMLFLAVSLLLA